MEFNYCLILELQLLRVSPGDGACVCVCVTWGNLIPLNLSSLCGHVVTFEMLVIFAP